MPDILRAAKLMSLLMLTLLLLLAGCSSDSSGSGIQQTDSEQPEEQDGEDGEETPPGDEENDETGGDEIIDPPFGVSSEGAGFRVDALILEHPHIIADDSEAEGINYDICDDVTFDPLLIWGFLEVAEGLNPTMQGMIDELELNMVQLHDPLGLEDGHTGVQAIVDAECDSATSCTPARDTVLSGGGFSVSENSACLDEVSGIYTGAWPDGRSTELNSAAAGEMACYVTDTTTLELSLDMLEEPLVLSLKDVRIAARYGDDAALVLEDGLILGFLSQEDADQVDIEIDEGMVLNLGRDLLPADGAGDGQACGERTHCAGPDARVTHNGECGWWFALNFHALRLEDVSGF